MSVRQKRPPCPEKKPPTSIMQRVPSGRQSLASAPLRVLNSNESSSKPGTKRTKIPTGASGWSSGSGRSSTGSRSSFGGRVSFGIKKPTTGMGLRTSAGGIRRSSGFGRGYGHEVFKDPRPINKKSFKDHCIRELVEFLSVNSYSHPLSAKILMSPTSKDFLRIFEFIYRFIDPKYHPASKPEDHIPLILKRLSYPFQISKSALFAVGSPHTWPAILAALTWLRELIQHVSSLNEDSILFLPGDDFDGISEQKYVFDYVEQTYLEFLNGEDKFEAQEEELAKKIRSCGAMADLDKLVAQNRICRDQLEYLQQKPDQLPSMKAESSSLSIDIEKMKSYNSTIDSHLHKVQEKEKAADTEVAEIEAELQGLLQNNERKQQIFDTQEFSPADVERMNGLELRRSIEAGENDIKDVEQQIWAEEVELAKAQEGIDRKCATYNRMASQLQLIPSSAEYANGCNYELRGKLSNYQSEKSAFTDHIKPGLMQLKKQAYQLVHEAEESRLNELEVLEQLTEMVTVIRQALNMLEAKQKRGEESLESTKKATSIGLQDGQVQIEQLQEQLSLLQKQSTFHIQDVQRQLKEDKLSTKQQAEIFKKEHQEYCDFLEQAVSLVADHKSIIQEHTQKICDDVAAACRQDCERLQAKGYKVDTAAFSMK